MREHGKGPIDGMIGRIKYARHMAAAKADLFKPDPYVKALHTEYKQFATDLSSVCKFILHVPMPTSELPQRKLCCATLNAATMSVRSSTMFSSREPGEFGRRFTMLAYSRRYLFRVGTAKLRACRVSVSEYWRHSETTYEELRSQSGTLLAPPWTIRGPF